MIEPYRDADGLRAWRVAKVYEGRLPWWIRLIDWLHLKLG